jgi:hypothetical protein
VRVERGRRHEKDFSIRSIQAIFYMHKNSRHYYSTTGRQLCKAHGLFWEVITDVVGES